MNVSITANKDITDAVIKSISNDVDKLEVKETKPVSKSKRIVAVYNPFDMDSTISAAILKKSIPHFNYVSFQDVVPENADLTFWVGVKKYQRKNYAGKDVVFTSEQPYYTVAKNDILSRIKGLDKLTNEQVFNNELITRLNGSDISREGYFQELAKVSILDKIMLHFGIESQGEYSYSYIARSLENREEDDDIYAFLYILYKNALEFLDDKAPFYKTAPSDLALPAFRDEAKLISRSLLKKIMTRKLEGVNYAIGSLDPVEYVIADYLYPKSGYNMVNIVHGLSGSFFYGNVELPKGAKLGEISEYINC